MIETVIGLNNVIEEHLEEVMEYMKNNGEATLRAIRHGELLLVLEGSHRLEAAKRLEIPINIKLINKNESVDLDSLDFDIDTEVKSYNDLVEFIGNGSEYQYDSYLYNLI